MVPLMPKVLLPKAPWPTRTDDLASSMATLPSASQSS
jgi:hypothetical protein